jgi:hypothetical protein
LLALAMIAICAAAFAVAGKAQAAECMTPEACYNAAVWQNAVARDYSNKAAWFRATSKQNFIDAKQWSDKAIFAFHAGDAVAATWYKAISDDYARKSINDSKAADDYAARAAFTRTAAAGNVKRAFQLTAFYNPPPTAAQEAADAQRPGDDLESGALSASAGTPPCRQVKNKDWNFAGIKMWIKPYNFCYQKPNHVIGVSASFDNAIFGPQDLDIDAEGCDREDTPYEWRSRGRDSGLKVTITCRWSYTPPVIKIRAGEMECKARLYLHSDGSAAYQKINEGDPTCELHGPFG